MHLDALNLIVRWAGVTGVFLLLTYFFRGRVTLEGFWGYVLLIFLVVPINIFEPYHDVVAEAIHPSLYVAPQAEDSVKASSPDSPLWEDPRTAVTYMLVLLPLNVLLMFSWSKWLPGMTITGWWAPIVFAAFLSAAALGLSLTKPIPTAEFFTIWWR